MGVNMPETGLTFSMIGKKLPWLIPGPVFYALFLLASKSPDFVESVYSRRVFRITNQALSSLTGLLPFSLGEMLLYALALFTPVYLAAALIASARSGKHWWRVLIDRLLLIACAVSVLYAIFAGAWALNYARRPLAESMGLSARPSTADELYQVCLTLTERANLLRPTLPEDERGAFVSVLSKSDILRGVPEMYARAAQGSGCGFLGGRFGRAKPVLASVRLSYLNITGVYFPFTGEANVNSDIPDLYFASTCLHEAAHQRGFAREDEANFLAYYVSTFSHVASIRYSGLMLALNNAMNQLYDANDEWYGKLRMTYCDGINRDLHQNADYWKRFEGPAEEASQQVNNAYLKVNLQQDGVKSYGRMVDLLIALSRSGKL